MTSFKLRFPLADVPAWAGRYVAALSPKDRDAEAALTDVISPAVAARGHYERHELLAAARWKSPRSAGYAGPNAAGAVEETTRVALATADERLRLDVLTLLAGVGRPTASVLLHFAVPERYPILDYRALWSLGVEPYRDDPPLWLRYASTCRGLARTAGVSMRDLDRALWQFSKEHGADARPPAATFDPPPPWDAPWFVAVEGRSHAGEGDHSSRLWLRPDPGAGDYDRAADYALTIGGYGYLHEVARLPDPLDGSGVAWVGRREGAGGRWAGPFAELRACLFLLQRGVRWAEGSWYCDDGRARFERCHQAVCDAWEREAPDHAAEVRAATVAHGAIVAAG